MNRTPEKVRYLDLNWNGLVDRFDLKFKDGSKKVCFRWERRGERKEGMNDIAREIVPATSPSFDAAFSKDLLGNPELYAYFRVKNEKAANQLNGKTVEFGFNSVMTAGKVSGNGNFLMTKHSDGTITV